jgi:hypothetical protein
MLPAERPRRVNASLGPRFLCTATLRRVDADISHYGCSWCRTRCRPFPSAGKHALLELPQPMADPTCDGKDDRNDGNGKNHRQHRQRKHSRHGVNDPSFRQLRTAKSSLLLQSLRSRSLQLVLRRDRVAILRVRENQWHVWLSVKVSVIVIHLLVPFAFAPSIERRAVMAERS